MKFSYDSSDVLSVVEGGAFFLSFFFNVTAPPEIYPLSLPDALPISYWVVVWRGVGPLGQGDGVRLWHFLAEGGGKKSEKTMEGREPNGGREWLWRTERSSVQDGYTKRREN